MLLGMNNLNGKSRIISGNTISCFGLVSVMEMEPAGRRDKI